MFMYTKPVTVIDLENGFYIDVEMSIDKSTKDFYIYHIDYEIKMFMFGLPHKYVDLIDIVERNKLHYMTIYKMKYMD